MTVSVSALTGGPSMPEYTQFEEVTSNNLVDPNTGNFTYSIPLLDVPGPEGGYPVALSYHSGISHEQEATWVGLGWSLNAGAINRVVRGIPDDYLNAVVVTHNQAEAFGGILTVNLGYGPLGISLNYDANSGQLVGSTPYFSMAGLLSMAQDAGRSETTPSALDVYFAGNPGVDFMAHQADITLTPQGANLSFGIGLASISVYNEWSELGPSVSANASLSAGAHGIGIGASIGWGATGDGNLQIHDFGSLEICINGFHIGAGYKSFKWSLNEDDWDLMSGFLWQAGPNSGVVPRRATAGNPTVGPDGTYSVTPGVEKYERLKVAKDKTTYDLISSQDLYMVAANGLTGTFEPYFAAPYSGYSGVFPTLQDGDLTKNLEGMKAVDPASLPDIGFRMHGDMGRNLLQVPSGDPDQIAPYLASGSSQKQYGSYRIDPVFDFENETGVKRSSIRGFRITDAEGKIFEFMQPVKNQLTAEVTSEDPTTITTNHSERMMYDPYAGSWLISAIKGADYVEISNSDGIPEEGDYGYWVKFNYSSPTPAAWATPYQGNIGSPTGDDIPGKKIYQRSTGYKELVFLESIETETHKAIFQPADRLDGYSMQNPVGARVELQPIKYPGKFPYILNADYIVPDYTYSLEFPGDFVSMLKRLYDNRSLLSASELNYPIMHLTEDWNSTRLGYVRRGVSYSIADFWERTINPITNGTGSFVGNSIITGRVYNASTGNSRFDFLWHFNPDENPRRIEKGYFFQLSLLAGAYIDINNIEFLLSRLPPEVAFPPPKLLSKVNLYNKKSPTTVIRSVQFRYNYELCPNTPNSYATAAIDGSMAPYYVAGGQAKGKLTLKEVQVYGQGIPMPAYRFGYQSGVENPGYGNKEQYDIWGMYKADGALGKHLTKQGDDKEGVCWNLNKISLPMGGSFDIEYQRDSYYFAGTSPHLLDGKESIYPDYTSTYVPVDAAGKPNFTSLAKVVVPAHTPVVYGGLPNFMNPAPDMANDNISSEFFKIPVQSLSFVPATANQVANLQLGDYVFIVQVLKATDRNNAFWSRVHNGILNMAIVTSKPSTTSLGLEPLIQKTSANGFFLWKDFSYSNYDFKHEYYLLPILPQNGKRIFYGGDVAVKSLISSDGLGNKYKTAYDYVAKDVRSAPSVKAYDAEYASGGTPGLPILYQSRFQFFPAFGNASMDEGLRMESNPFIDYVHTLTIQRPAYDPVGDFIKRTYYAGDKPGGYYYPNPGISYSRVTAQQVPEPGSSERIGSTEYQFFGIPYYFLHNGSVSGGQPVINRVFPDWSVTEASNVVTIRADVLAKQNQLAALISYDKNNAVVSKVVNKYSQTANLFDKGTPKTNSAPGWVKQTYSSKINVGTSTPGPTRKIQFYSPASYLSGTESTQDGVTSKIDNIGLDAASGSLLAVSKTNSDGRSTVDYSLPAYWVRPEMEEANALSQTREKRTYGLPSGEAFVPAKLDRVIAANYSEWSKDYAGPDGGGAGIATNTWKKTFTAVWNPPLDANGIPNIVYAPPSYGPNSADFTPTPWRISSNSTVFNKFSFPVETHDPHKSTYSAIYTGHGSNLVIGTVGNCRFGEAGIFTGDYDLGEPGYFDKFNGWEKGGVSSTQISEVAPGFHIFGSKPVHVKNSFGPSISVKYEYARYRPYVLSAWVLPASGTTTLFFDFRDADGVVVKDANGNAIPVAGVNVTADGGGWRLVQAVMPSDIDIPWQTAGLRAFAGCPSGGEAYFQDIRFHPIDSPVTTYFYDPITHDLLTIIDENNHPKYFTYDGLRRLTSIKNEKLETISDFSYQFFAP